MQRSLDSLLRQAAAEPAHRPAFFQYLLTATVWVAAQQQGTRFDPEFRYSLEGHALLPFFSTEDALTQVLGDLQPRCTVTVTDLFKACPGQTLCLNPALSEGKIFTASEVQELLASAGNALATESAAPNGESLLLSVVAQPEPQLVASLSELFRQQKAVKRGFVAWCKEHPDSAGNLLIGIEASEGIDEIIQAAGHVALDTLPEDTLIDFCEVRGQEDGISHFFSAHIPPFYQRPHGSFLRGMSLS